MISISMIGNLGKDAEVFIKDEKRYLSINIAESNSDAPQWAECSMRISDESKLPEYLKKGVRVYVSGYPHVKAWAGKDGKPAGTLGIYIDKLELLSPKE